MHYTSGVFSSFAILPLFALCHWSGRPCTVSLLKICGVSFLSQMSLLVLLLYSAGCQPLESESVKFKHKGGRQSKAAFTPAVKHFICLVSRCSRNIFAAGPRILIHLQKTACHKCHFLSSCWHHLKLVLIFLIPALCWLPIFEACCLLKCLPPVWCICFSAQCACRSFFLFTWTHDCVWIVKTRMWSCSNVTGSQTHAAFLHLVFFFFLLSGCMLLSHQATRGPKEKRRETSFEPNITSDLLLKVR